MKLIQLERGLDLNTSFTLLRPEFIERAVYIPINGKNFSSRIWKNKEDMVKRLRSVLERSLIDGKDPAKLAREISKAYGTSAYESARLTQTEVAKCCRQANDLVFEESGVVESVIFDATLDGSTSQQCADNDGKEFSLDNKPEIPLHPNCRSEYLPKVSGWTPSKKLDNETKQTVNYSSYNKWAKDRGIS